MERLVEICCGSYEDALNAYKGKAKRIELNSALYLGGLTPSLASLKLTKKNTNLKVITMVRPRGAGFYYNDIEFEDLAIVYRWNLGNDSLGTYTNLVNNDLAAKEGLTENDLYNAANKNTKELFPVSIKNMNEVISEIIFGESELGEEMQEEFNEVMMETPNEHSMYVITNESKLYGAASMLYEEPLHELAEKVGSDLYILPSSVHEVIAVSADFSSPDELAEMVYEINMDQVDINDRLSNQVYCYDKDLRTLRLATDTINKSLDDVDRGAISTPEREGR